VPCPLVIITKFHRYTTYEFSGVVHRAVGHFSSTALPVECVGDGWPYGYVCRPMTPVDRAFLAAGIGGLSIRSECEWYHGTDCDACECADYSRDFDEITPTFEYEPVVPA
jgi:hypothetical protein